MDDDERRARVLAEARAHIAKLHDGNPKPEVEVEPRPPLEVEDRRARSLRFHAEREADRAAERARRRAAEAEHIRQQQQEPIAFSELQQKILGGLVSEVRQQLRDEFAEQISELRADFHVMRSIDKGRVLDLPALPPRRRSDAA